MVAFVIQVNTPPGSSTEQVKVASSPGQTQRVFGETDPFTASEKGTIQGTPILHIQYYTLMNRPQVYIYNC